MPAVVAQRTSCVCPSQGSPFLRASYLLGKIRADSTLSGGSYGFARYSAAYGGRSESQQHRWAFRFYFYFAQLVCSCRARCFRLHALEQIIQYINLVRSDSLDGNYGSAFYSIEGGLFPWLSADEFEEDEEAGHGTHTAGSAAGATLKSPAETVTCNDTKVLSCAGGCIDPDITRSDDDLVSALQQESTADIDRLCPMFDCAGGDEQLCLSDDVSETLTQYGGIAQGAKLAIFDFFFRGYGLSSYPGNGLWETCADAGCKVHSNSYGADYWCSLSSDDVVYDGFMYEVSWSCNAPFGRSRCTVNYYIVRVVYRRAQAI